MDIWDEIKKLSGYQSGRGGVDSYGVDHSGFSTRDELEYQSARLARENQLAEGFAKQGIAEENYPQFGTNFWGGSPENNYGFGTSNIKQNIENITNRLNNNTNNGQVFANSDYTVNTESLVGKPSSYFQNNNSVGGFSNNNTGNTANTIGQSNSNTMGNNNPNTWSNTGSFVRNKSNGPNANTNFGANQSFATTSTQQMTTPTPWSNPAEQISPVPWRNNQTITPWAGGYDLSAPTQSNDIQSIDYSRYGEGFSKEFIDKMENDKEFQKILNEYIIPNEGGYNNDPADAGGETNMGIAQNAHTDEDIKNMTRERANAIYYRDYYNWNGLNKLPYPIRGFVVDYGLPTRPQLAVETVHKVLDIPLPSNIIGPTTLGKFENYTEEDYNNFLDKYREEMKKHFREVAQKNPQKRKFLNGWLNRADGAHLAR